MVTSSEMSGAYYIWHEAWAEIPEPLSGDKSNGRTHGIAVSRTGSIFLFHQAIPAVLVLDSYGQLIERWGDYPGAHGLTLVEEDGHEFLWLTDERRKVVQKTTLDGAVVQCIDPPDYAAEEPYIPTWVAVNEKRFGGNGDFWVADGYGSSRLVKYDATGHCIMTLDGTSGAGRFKCPHGVWFDTRKTPMELYVADRKNHRAQVYDNDGNFLRTFGENFLDSPDGFAVDGDRLIVPELKGKVAILDRNDHLVGYLGRNEEVCNDPLWPDRTPLKLAKFNSPHAAAADSFGNLFIVEWRVGGRVIKLERVETPLDASSVFCDAKVTSVLHCELA